jgi:hypothetical protein
MLSSTPCRLQRAGELGMEGLSARLRGRLAAYVAHVLECSYEVPGALEQPASHSLSALTAPPSQPPFQHPNQQPVGACISTRHAIAGACISVRPCAHDAATAAAPGRRARLRQQAHRAAGRQVLMGVLRKELEPGLHISRRSQDDFHRFLRVARFFTCFVRLREAGRAAPCHVHTRVGCRLLRTGGALLYLHRGSVAAGRRDVLEHHRSSDQVGAALPKSELFFIVRSCSPPWAGVVIGLDECAHAGATGMNVRMRAPQERQHKRRLERKAAGDAAEPAPADGPEGGSPFAVISATMGWETFFLVQMLWLGASDLPPRAPEKDWPLQARGPAGSALSGSARRGQGPLPVSPRGARGCVIARATRGSAGCWRSHARSRCPCMGCARTVRPMRVSLEASSRAGAQHASLALLKEMLATLDVAQRTGTPADRKAADRLQRRQESYMAQNACLSEPQRSAACTSWGDPQEPAPSLHGAEVGSARVSWSPCRPAGAQRVRVCLGREPLRVLRLRQAAARRPEGERLPAGAGAPDQGFQPQAAAAVACGRPRRDAAPRPAPAGAAVAPGCAARMLGVLHTLRPLVASAAGAACVGMGPQAEL